MKTTLTADERTAALCTCVHESGHYIIAAHFGLHPSIALLTPRDGYCCFDEPPRPEVGEACCWGGFMAEDLLGHRKGSRTIPATPLTEEGLERWIGEIKDAEMTNRVPWLSASDRSHIHGFQRNSAPQTAFHILNAHKGELAELANYALALFTPSLARNQSLNLNVLKAALAQTGGSSRYPLADTAAERLAQIALDAQNAEKDALTATIASHKFAADLDRLGPLATKEGHRHAADLSCAAVKLLLAAKKAVEAHNIAWAKEFEEALAAGDEAAAHSASWSIDIRKPLALMHSADAEMEKMIEHSTHLQN